MLFKSVKYLLFQIRRRRQKMNSCFFWGFLPFIFSLLLLFVQGRLCFCFHPLTHWTEGCFCSAPLEQAPAVEVPCLRALWSEDRTFLHVFVQGNFQPVNCDHFFCPPSCWDEPHRFFILLFASWDIQGLNIWVFFRIFPMDFMRQSTPRVCRRSFSHSCQ